jgi:signal transduction histidine kinase
VLPLQRSAEVRSRFLAELFDSIEAERRRIAHELHDGVGQSLTLLVSGLKSLPQSQRMEDRIEELQGLAFRTLKDVKTLALGLRPSLLDDLGLVAAIERIAADVRENRGLSVQVDATGFDERRLPDAVETAIFRIIQEALNNVSKHAAATRAAITLQREDGWITCTVNDDGRGMNGGASAFESVAPGHLGLIGMRERATLLGGQFELTSIPGQGTRVQASIPLENPS